MYSHKPERIQQAGSVWRVTAGEITAEAPYLLNATYAGVNDVHAMLGLPPFQIKYEKCEIILCTADERLKHTGITVMDGPFFSLMPFGQTGLHSLTSVTFTPTRPAMIVWPPSPASSRAAAAVGRATSITVTSARQAGERLALHEPAGPEIPERGIRFCLPQQPVQHEAHPEGQRDRRLRPTVIRVMSEEPKLVSVLSGKINTVYDLDEVLEL